MKIKQTTLRNMCFNAEYSIFIVLLSIARLSIVLFSIIMQNEIMLSVIMLSVSAHDNATLWQSDVIMSNVTRIKCYKYCHNKVNSL
jgi:hypothetical protein